MFGNKYIYVVSQDPEVRGALDEAEERLTGLVNALEGLDGVAYIRTNENGYTVNVVSNIYKYTFSAKTIEELVSHLVSTGTHLQDILPEEHISDQLRVLTSLDNTKITTQVLKDIEDNEILKELVHDLVHHDAILGYNSCSVSIYRYSNHRNQISYVLDIRHLNRSAGEDGVQRRKFEYSAKTSVSIDKIRTELDNYVSSLEPPENYEVLRFS